MIVLVLDENECETPANNCPYLCKNLIGSFMCICPDGYEQVGSTGECRDVDECSEADLCNNGRCINEPGGYRCDCHRNYQQSHDGKSCIGNIHIHVF